MLPLVEVKKREHEKRLKEYKDKVLAFKKQHGLLTSDNPMFSAIVVIEMGIGFEPSSMEWCNKVFFLPA